MTDLTIPEYLKRNKDGTFVQMRGEGRDVVFKPRLPPVNHAALSEGELNAMLDDLSLTLLERQPIYKELRAREDKRKAYARIEKLKASKAKE